MNCFEATRLIVEEGDAHDGTARELERHVATCARCREQLETQRIVRTVLAARPDEPLPAGFQARLRARLALERERGTPAPAIPFRRGAHGARATAAAAWRTWSLRLLPAAAMVVLGVLALRPEPAPDAACLLIEWSLDESGAMDVIIPADRRLESLTGASAAALDTGGCQ